jgi:3',5'-cyclic-AMP phosphodiesterase
VEKMISVLLLLAGSFHFVILGDRTGEAQPGVYEQIWKETAAENPAFVVTVGDTIQGLADATADAEWHQVERILAPYKRWPLYLTPGNHDIWSELSEKLYTKYSGHAVHYSFDHEQAHFSVLDNSRTEVFSANELEWLESDLQAHRQQPLKFVISHRPSWIVEILLKNPKSAIHQLAKKYGVQYVISGHIHQMLHANLEGVEYLSMPSAGGHLRGTKKYEDGWFFAHTLVTIDGTTAQFQIKEMKPSGRVSAPGDWGASGLVHH